jgi:hypothetical protein
VAMIFVSFGGDASTVCVVTELNLALGSLGFEILLGG